MDTGGSFPLKWLGHETDHSPPCSTEVKNEWSYICIPLYAFMAWYLDKHGDNFTFTNLTLFIEIYVG
jgi:hypothetical protein